MSEPERDGYGGVASKHGFLHFAAHHTAAPRRTFGVWGEDLRDFYYFFAVSLSLRNVLSGPLPESLARQYCGFEGVEQGHQRYYSALSTLAMGDRNGQTAHVALLLKTGLVSVSELLSHDNRPSPGSFLTGICVDDLVTIEKTTASGAATKAEGDGAAKPRGTRNAKLLQTIRESYEAVGLERNPDKAFEDEEVASFCGARIDGSSGDVRTLHAFSNLAVGFFDDRAGSYWAGDTGPPGSHRRMLRCCLFLSQAPALLSGAGVH